MKDTITISRLTDITTLMDWRMEVLHCVFADASHADYDTLYRNNLDYYTRAIPAGDHTACLALVDGESAGCGGVCMQRELPSPDNPSGKCAYLMNIYVREDRRHHGVGESIVAWLVEQARQAGAQKIYLETTHAARSLYQSLGFTTMHDMLKL